MFSICYIIQPVVELRFFHSATYLYSDFGRLDKLGSRVLNRGYLMFVCEVYIGNALRIFRYQYLVDDS